MSSFSKIFARLFLILQCLMPNAYIKCTNNEPDDVDKAKRYYNEGIDLSRRAVYATIRRTKLIGKNGPFCGAAWIETEYLISAASCLDDRREMNLKALDNYFDVEVFPLRKDRHSYLRRKTKTDPKYKGRGVTHPLYQRDSKTGTIPIAYDVALLFIVDFGKDSDKDKFKMPTGLCSNSDMNNRHDEWFAVGISTHTGEGECDYGKRCELEEAHEWKLNVSHENIAIFRGREYYIDPSKQFTAYLLVDEKRKLYELKKTGQVNKKRFLNIIKKKLIKNRQQKFDNIDNIYEEKNVGWPILKILSPETPDFEAKSCIAGIVSFSGRNVTTTKENSKSDIIHYITSTKVDHDLLDWIIHTKKVSLKRSNDKKITSSVLSKPTRNGKEKFEREWWKNEFNKQRIGIHHTVNGKETFDPAGSLVDRTKVQ